MKKVCVFALVFCLSGVFAQAADITMVAGDGMGSSSLVNGTGWPGGLAPTAGNDYFTGDYRLRTPADGGSHTFAGDSLTINNTNGYNGGLMYKGTGSTGSITIGNLILDGGMISHGNGTGDVCNLYGNINVVSDSILYPKQGAIRLYSNISGTSQITIQASDNNSGNKIWIHSSANTFTGNIVNNGRLELADNANLNFVIGAAGVNNKISNGAAGTQQHSIFGGDFMFDLTNASTTLGDSWNIISTVAASTYYNASFSVLGFSDMGDDTWLGSANGVNYEFSKATGMLTVVPEPATMVLLGLGSLMAAWRRR